MQVTKTKSAYACCRSVIRFLPDPYCGGVKTCMFSLTLDGIIVIYTSVKLNTCKKVPIKLNL